MTFPDHDFWLLDDEIVALNVYAEDGSSFGARLSTEPAVVEQCMKLRDRLLAIGIPHERYVLH